ncbi:MAG: Dam family site-specific DNA-(adenine-N6)-methyltransferase [Verrucomicrobiota bacterium]
MPPLKCQGIKTRLVGEIRRISQTQHFERWVEPFCGSCVVALNVQPERALLCDSNVHIIQLYQNVQSGSLTPGMVREFLVREGERLSAGGEEYYYTVRERFNRQPSSLDFLFLNRSCFNGVMRFNRKGGFNVPYCHKKDRFAQAYVTKITNQIRRIADVVAIRDWTFAVSDFRQTLRNAAPGDLVYADPPYAGRHVDYFNSWSEADEQDLASLLKGLPCGFILSTWHSNEFRSNAMIAENWNCPGVHVLTRQHFYHVGSSEDLRHPMVEALITNFAVGQTEPEPREDAGQLAFFERASSSPSITPKTPCARLTASSKTTTPSSCP